MADGFIPPHGNWRELLSYQKAEVIFDATNFFCERYIDKRSRTYDQMIQAARSGKQNIIEGNEAGATSKQTEIHLTNVARGSLKELLGDYEDFLRNRRAPKWTKDDPRAQAVRQLTYGSHVTYETYRSYVEGSSPEVAANTIICLIHQACYLLDQQLRSLQKDFLQHGGIRERMTRARLEERNKADR